MDFLNSEPLVSFSNLIITLLLAGAVFALVSMFGWGTPKKVGIPLLLVLVAGAGFLRYFSPSNGEVDCQGEECSALSAEVTTDRVETPPTEVAEAEPPPSPVEPSGVPTAEEEPPPECGQSTDCQPSEYCVSGDCLTVTVDDCERLPTRCEVFAVQDHGCVVESVDRTCCVSNSECRQRHNDEAGWECVPAEGTFECRFRPCENHDDCADGFRCRDSGTDGLMQCRPFACGDSELMDGHDCVPDPSAPSVPRIILGGNLDGSEREVVTPRNPSVRVERRVTPVSSHCDRNQRDCSECPDMTSRRSCMYGED